MMSEVRNLCPNCGHASSAHLYGMGSAYGSIDDPAVMCRTCCAPHRILAGKVSHRDGVRQGWRNIPDGFGRGGCYLTRYEIENGMMKNIRRP